MQVDTSKIPAINVDYPVSFGSSFGRVGEDGSRLRVLRYDFQPASLSRLSDGVLAQDEDNKVNLSHTLKVSGWVPETHTSLSLFYDRGFIMTHKNQSLNPC